MEFREFMIYHQDLAGIPSSVLAKRVWRSPAFIRGIRSGYAHPSKETACRILTVLNVYFEEIDSRTIKVDGGYIFEFKA